MNRQLQSILCLATVLLAGPVFAQSASLPLESKQSVAYVYVSAATAHHGDEVYAFAAGEEGRLTKVHGSPFAANIDHLAVGGNQLFGTVPPQKAIDSFSIQPDGALAHTASLDGQKYNGDSCGGPGALFADRTGASLYDLDYNGDGCANNTYQSFRIDKKTGDLGYLGKNGESSWFSSGMKFVGNNRYAYGAVCLGDMYWEIYGFKRHSDGMLIEENIAAPTPDAKGGDFYCPNLTATDPANHVVISMQPVNGETFNTDGATRLATYSAEENGNLTTTSTRDNMAETAVGAVTGIDISPGGKLLAVGGTRGLQVFHFEGGEPIKHYTGLLTKDPITQLAWDNAHHLYALSKASGKLFVFIVTPTSVTQAAGSPYTINHPQALSVFVNR